MEETTSLNQEKKSKKKWLVVGLPAILILSLIVLIGVFLYQNYRFRQLAQRQPLTRSQSLLSPLEEAPLVLEIPPIESGKLADWATYSNPKAGFSLKYPPHQVLGVSTECKVDLGDYPKEIADNSGERVMLVPEEPCGRGFMVRFLDNPSHLPPLEFWMNILGSVRCNADQTECYRDYKYEGKEDKTAIYSIQGVKIAGHEGIKIVVKEVMWEVWGEDIYLPGKEGQILLIQFQPSSVNDQIIATLQFTNP